MSLVAALRRYLIDHSEFDGDHVTTVPPGNDQIASPQPTLVILRPLGGPGGGDDLELRRITVTVVAERYDLARSAFSEVRDLLRGYDYRAVDTPSRDQPYQTASGVEKPAHSADFLIQVPVETAP